MPFLRCHAAAFVKIVVPCRRLRKPKKLRVWNFSSRGIFASFVSKTRDWITAGGGFKTTSNYDPFFAWLSVVAQRWRFGVCFGALSTLSNKDTWLILPVVICLSQRLSHACLSINNFILWNCVQLIISVIIYLMVIYYMDNRGNSRANTCVNSRLTKGRIY